jgi:hypothetical protein
MENIDFDQFERRVEEELLGADDPSSDDSAEGQSGLVPLFVDQPISEHIPSAPSIAEISIALVELQRKFKISVAAMDRFAGLLRIATGSSSVAPKFSEARAMQEESDIDFRVVDCCVNDDCVFENAPAQCDPTGARQHADLHKCPNCDESRFVLVGSDKGTPRKQIIVFSLQDTIKMLFAQPGFSQKLNGNFGQPHLAEDANFEMKVGSSSNRLERLCRTFGTVHAGRNRWLTARK